MIKSISTDSIGWLGNENHFLNLYYSYFKNKIINGVEIIPFKPIIKTLNFVNKIKNLNINKIKFHGQTGGENYLKFFNKITMTVVNKTIIDLKNLLLNFSDYELLFHEPLISERKNLGLIIKNPPKILTIENHQPYEKGLEKIIKIIDILRKNKINCYGLIDIYHFTLNEKPEKIVKNWEKNILKIKAYLQLKDERGVKYFNSIHFPIGSRKTDSLPINLLTDNQLEFFAKNILPFINSLTIENQQEYLGLIYPFNINKIKKRNQLIFNRLKKAGIL